MSSDRKLISESNGFLNSWINTLIFGNEETKTSTPSSMIEQQPTTSSFNREENQSNLPQRPISHPLPTIPFQHHNNNQQYDHHYHHQNNNNRLPRPLPNVPLNNNDYINQYQYIHPHPNQHRLSTPIPPINNDLALQPQQQQRAFSFNALNSDQFNFQTQANFSNLNDTPKNIPSNNSNNNNNNNLFNNQDFLATDLTLNETTQNNSNEEEEEEGEKVIDKNKIEEQQNMNKKEEIRPSKKHYGPAPLRTRRRYGTKRMQLTSGNLVVENPVPMTYLSVVPRKDDEEFRKMRYTAATCDPDLFISEGYKLRQQIDYRETEIHIVITMYNVI